MPLHDVNGGVAFSFGEKLFHTEANEIVTQAQETRVGSNLSTDADQALSLVDGNIYRTTMTLTTDRTISLPITGITGNPWLFFKFNHNDNGVAHKLTFRHTGGGQIIFDVDSSPSGSAEGAASIYWDGSAWRTFTADARTNLTITVTQ